MEAADVGLQVAAFRRGGDPLGGPVALPLRTSYREFEEMLDERGGEVDLARSRRAGVPH